MAYQNLTFWGYTRVNLEAPVNLNHNIQVLATLMKASEDDESNRRWILALASIGIEYTCLSLFAAVCIGNLHNGKEAMQVEKIPVKLEVNAAERCLESMCCLMDAASSRRFRHVSDIPNTDMTRENAIYDTINDETAYCRMAYGLFAAFSSIRGGSTPMQSLMHKKEPDKDGSFQTVLLPKNALCWTNCVSRMLLAAVTCEKHLSTKVDLTADRATESCVAERAELGMDQFMHVSAIDRHRLDDWERRASKTSPWRITSQYHDMAFFLMSPLESIIHDSSLFIKGGHQESCKQYYIENLIRFLQTIRGMIRDMGHPTSREARRRIGSIARSITV